MFPSIKYEFNSEMKGDPTEGKVSLKYQPFHNLQNKSAVGNENSLVPLRLKASVANINIDSTINLEIEESYDGSANLIINDGINPLKLINSRFYLTDSQNYKIGDRKGNVDTNVYSIDNFLAESSLIKTVNKLVKVDFIGLSYGGKMPIGNYTFYFKLADSDGNESDFIAESGKIITHIGNINNPKTIRGGQFNENSGKTINITLKNLDLAYTYINVYYVRSTGEGVNQINTAHKISQSYKIKGIKTSLNITGYEVHEEIALSEINIQQASFDSVKSITNCQNISFAGNITNNYDLYRLLEKYSLFVVPELNNTKSIGNLSESYKDINGSEFGYEYYNPKNIYYRLGYWDDEIYRFGIVYILNDYTLSPVFNIRGVRELTSNTSWNSIKGSSAASNANVTVLDDYSIDGTDGLENAKGVFKISHGANGSTTKDIFQSNSINPIGLGFRFYGGVLDMMGGLKELTKGFFIVRQPRIPTILAQSIGISTTKHGHLPTIKSADKYVIESFLTKDGKGKPFLNRNLKHLPKDLVINNALLCPEADLRTEVFNTYFNSSTYSIKKSKYQPVNKQFNRIGTTDQYNISKLTNQSGSTFRSDVNLLLIEPNISLINNSDSKFSSVAGNDVSAHDAIDVEFGDYNDPSITIKNMDSYNYSDSKVRGVFNTYIGTNSKSIEQAAYYDIYEQGYDFENNWKNYFLTRMNDSSPYSAVSDRIEWNELKEAPNYLYSDIFYRGDCYINTFTHRMNWNFTDPELPTNNRIIDKYTWYKNWRVSNKASTTVNLDGNEDTELQYNKLLPLFTYRNKTIATSKDEDLKDEPPKGLLEPTSKRYKKYSELNGIFGTDKLNRPDINAVGLGHWVTMKVCSNVNLAMRDVDLDRPSEEALFGIKRSFYPLQGMERSNKLPESRILNSGISKTRSDKYYFDLGDIPFIKDSFTTRIYYSNVLQQSTFVNGNRVFLSKNYQDYSMEHGEIIKLIDWFGTIIAVMERGILMIPVNERAMMANESGENIYINTENTLPKNPRVVSDTFGSMWADSVVKTGRFIYGIDTIGKKIWRTNGEHIELISDMKVQQFLNDNMNLKTSDKNSEIFKISIKSHYNAFKQDVHFVFNVRGKTWHLCWNEALEKWVTRYSWFPAFSENINNIFYTFADTSIHKNSKGILYKHGFAGNNEEKGEILPTKWYDEQHPFEFEFVVADTQGVQKIFNNLNIISNRVEPNSIIYEFTGDGYEWRGFKKDIVTEINKIGQDDDENLLSAFGSPFKKIF